MSGLGIWIWQFIAGVAGTGVGVITNYWRLEDDSGYWLLEDGSGKWLLE